MELTHPERLQYTDIGHGMGGAVLWMAIEQVEQQTHPKGGCSNVTTMANDPWQDALACCGTS